MRYVTCCCSNNFDKRLDSGQATVEAAFLIPVVMIVLGILLQPSILLYDRMVMEAAAGQALRILSTRPANSIDEGYKDVILQQLESIPDIDIFHSGDWEIYIEGNESSSEVSVRIIGKVQPLPLLGIAAGAIGLLDENDMFTLEVEASSQTQPSWVFKQGSDPSLWVDQWGE